MKIIRKKGIFSWYGFDTPIIKRLKKIKECGFDSTMLWWGDELSFKELNKQELILYKEKIGYNLGQLELDYYQHKLLSIIYNNFNKIYFKGGTCLQKCYGIKRFSEDLDFNIINTDPKEIIKKIESAMIEEIKLKEYYKTRFGISFKISIKGMLYDETQNSKCNVSFDMRFDDTYLEPIKLIITPIYSDINRYFLLALSKEEILAEKVRAIMTRNKGRDVFDLHELLLSKTKIDKSLIDKKLKTYNMKFCFYEFKKHFKEKKFVYDVEMKKLVNIYPDFDTIEKNTFTIFKDL